MRQATCSKFLWLMILISPSITSVFSQQQFDDLFLMSLEELLSVKVISASNSEEKLSEAPATMIVLSKQDIQNRGYHNLSEIFDDLPGMEVIRPFGDTYYTNYMRGYRYTIGTPFLVMLDGVIINTMYFGISTPMATIPLTHIKQIEVVYGPVSSVYGANAFMGVVNILTLNDRDKDGSYLDSRFTFASDDSLIADYSYFYKKEDWRLNFSLRVEESNLANKINRNDYYWLQDQHYQNRALWGNFVDNSALVENEYSSYISNRGIDFRLYTGDIEFAAQYWLLDTGYGTVYPADRIPANSTWPRVQYGAYLRYQKSLSETASSKTLLRYRFDGISNDAYDLEGYNLTNNSASTQTIGGVELAPEESARFLFFQYWQTQNVGWELFQDFDFKLNQNWQLNTGFKYATKDLQKAYDLNSSGAIGVEFADPNNSELFPQPPSQTLDNRNRITWEDKGLYLQAKYLFDKNNILNAGLRLDRNSAYGTATTFRMGYIRQFDRFIVKFLYGEAFQEPVPRSLYGGWTGSGSDPSLSPEESNTIETSISYTQKYISHLLSLYRVDNKNTAINFSGGARNAGERKVTGLDYHLNYQTHFNILGDTKFWAYYSTYLSEKEDKFDLTSGNYLKSDSIGDLAKHKVFLGITANPTEQIKLTLTGRYIGERDTVETNPIDKIDAYWTVDSNLLFEDLLLAGLSVSLKVTNLFDRDYYHPGIRDADAGDPDLFTSHREMIGFSGPNNLVWSGSLGWYNSRLPQPGRSISLNLISRF